MAVIHDESGARVVCGACDKPKIANVCVCDARERIGRALWDHQVADTKATMQTAGWDGHYAELLVPWEVATEPQRDVYRARADAALKALGLSGGGR